MYKRGIILTTFLLLFCLLNAFLYEEVLAGECCTLENNKFICSDSSSHEVINAWKKYDDKWYYLSSNGTILKNCIFGWGTASYYVDASGKMVQNSWVYIDEAQNSAGDFDEGWYYFGHDGRSYCRKNNSFKKVIDGKTYIFNEAGLMLTGWFDKEGYSINELENPFIDGIYFSKEDGALLTEQWLDYETISIKYKGADLYRENTEWYENKWIFFDENSKKIYNRSKNIEGILYKFDENGIVNMRSTLWKLLPKDSIHKIGEKYYAFDGSGEKKTGFVLFDGKSKFISQHDIDSFSSDDLKKGSIDDIENFDLYLFSQSEAEGGSMQTGKEIIVDLSDGVFYFGFSDNGKAYGNRNKLQRKDDKYYINGLRLDADKEYGYGIVEINKNTEVYYKVVDTNGKMVKGDKKAVKDKEGGYLIIINGRFIIRVDDEEKPKWKTGEEGTGFYNLMKESFIAGYDTVPTVDNLPVEERLNY
ncbi:cell surface protein [Lacrimispora sp. 38-1]|uniref:cell surface protein n=1 Tax=Lacrimispora sp. 38-1 TaxID=3125778 RepID=UPI003CF0889B